MNCVLACGCVGVVGMAIGGCEADLPPITDATGGLDAKCVGPYADLIIDYFPNTLDATPALGAPDMMSVVLQTDSSFTVAFVGLGGVSDAAGIDLKVHATVDPGALAIVRVAGSDMQYVYAGDVNGMTSEIDIAVADNTRYAVYARVIGINGTVRVDALQATHDMCQ